VVVVAAGGGVVTGCGDGAAAGGVAIGVTAGGALTAATWKERVTGAAPEYETSPGCVASIVQVPVATSVTAEPETVQTDVVELEKSTGSPLVAVAVSATEPWSRETPAGAVKAIDCAPGDGGAAGNAVTWNDRGTGVAATYDASPACVAVIEHVPVVTRVTVEPLTVQTPVVVLANDTASPLDAVADKETGPWSTRVSAGCAKAIDCAVGPTGTAVTWNDCDTGVAAAQLASPACVAVIEHVPVETSVTLAPLTVQTPVVVLANDTGSPLTAVAVSATGPWSTRVSAGWMKLIDCALGTTGAAVTWND
jgi:hypothetical protein